MTDRQLFAAILNVTKGGAMAAFEEYERCRAVRSKMEHYRTETAAMRTRYDMERKEMDNFRTALQAECTHPLTTFQSDPSGNNDSCHECEICGKRI